MALRKENFDYTHERARAMENTQQTARQDSVSVEISSQLYYRTRFAAALKDLTMRQYVEQILDEMVPEINDIIPSGYPPTREAVERLRAFREQVFRENNSQFMGDSVEELREIREER